MQKNSLLLVHSSFSVILDSLVDNIQLFFIIINKTLCTFKGNVITISITI